MRSEACCCSLGQMAVVTCRRVRLPVRPKLKRRKTEVEYSPGRNRVRESKKAGVQITCRQSGAGWRSQSHHDGRTPDGGPLRLQEPQKFRSSRSGQTAEKEERAFWQAPHSQVPFTVLVGGNHNHAAAVRASAVCGGAQRIRPDRSSGLEPLSESSANPAIIRLFKRQSQTSLPQSTCSEQFFCVPQSMHTAHNH